MNTQTQLVAHGLLAGDAASAMNAEFQVYGVPARRLSRLRALSKLSDDDNTTNIPRPFVHASPPALLHPAPAEASEWFAYALWQHTQFSSREERLANWQDLAGLEPSIKTRIGLRSALTNLNRGLTAPQSGNDNPHYFDDLAMPRAVAVAVTHSDDATLLDAVRADAEITHGRDGVWCAQATAVLIRHLLNGASAMSAVQQATAVLPEGTWSRRLAEESLSAAAETSGGLQRALVLSTKIGDWIYSYPVAAPETFAFLLAHVAQAGSAEDLLLGALAQPRNGAVLAALAGAAAAAMFGTGWAPAALDAGAAVLKGHSLPTLQGKTLAEITATR
ncbi:ADP-ribosylglycohydrolase family protein [Nocardioides sp. NBC_00368]|uniref:ADP-ribosylglycohydrolase family protein n=1 Tax=Nocardioides sp. NBC_00368 TaxID=2976000 RepID=UPI002E1D0B35